MSEQLSQLGLTEHGLSFGDYEYYNIGATTLKELRAFKIIPNKNYTGFLSKKPDGILVDRRDKDNIKVICVVEHKSSTEFDTPKKKQKAIKQCLDNYCLPLEARFGIVTDTKEWIWINPAANASTDPFISKEDGYPLETPFLFKSESEKEQTLALLQKLSLDVSESNSQLKKEVYLNPSKLADNVWQTIWLASGENPDACLATFVEIFVFKYLSDLGVLTQDESGNSVSFDFVLSVDRDKCLRYYNGNVRPYIKKLFPANVDDGTSIINGSVLRAEVSEHNILFNKIIKSFHDFGALINIDPEFKSRLYENFLKKSISQKNWGQFFTPRNIVKAMIEMSEIEQLPDGAKVHDPASGVGGFILEPLLGKRAGDFYFEGGEIKRKIHYSGFDRDLKTVILGKANMLIHLNELIKANPNATLKFADLFNTTFKSYHNSVLGSLSETPEGIYDLVLTNPPFVVAGTGKLKEFIKENGTLKTYYNINASGVEGLFCEQIIKSLKPGGKAIFIVPDGILNRAGDSKIRDFILKNCHLDAVISLPRNAFYTTSKKTYILAITKKKALSEVQTGNVFTYLIKAVGETLDANRFEADNDLPKMVLEFKYFKADKSAYTCNSKQCKLFPISTFGSENYWSIDRRWTHEELVELGLSEQEDTKTLQDFIDTIKTQKLAMDETIQSLATLEKTEDADYTSLPITLSDSKYFKLFIGKRVLKKDYHMLSKGDVPVYSANVKEPFAFGATSNITDFDNDFVLWGIDGDFDFNYIAKGTKFRTTDHCGTIRILDPNISMVYLYYRLNWTKKTFAMDRELRASLRNFSQVVVDIPVKLGEDGKPLVVKDTVTNDKGEVISETERFVFDLEAQNKIADFYKKFDEEKLKLIESLNDINEFQINPLA